MITMKRSTIAASLCLALAAGFANAATYSNTNDASSIIYFGAPDTTSYGQTFNTLGGTLNDWTFYTTGGNSGNLSFAVASWDGTKAVGPALYSSGSTSYGGGATALSFSGINTSLSAGSYIAYLTVAGVGSPATSVAIAGSNSDGGLGGGFRFLNSNGTDPLTLNNAWSSWSIPNMQYSASFDVAAPVPEPETYAMMLAGLGMLGFMARRRKLQAAA